MIIENNRICAGKVRYWFLSNFEIKSKSKVTCYCYDIKVNSLLFNKRKSIDDFFSTLKTLVE